MFFHEQPNLYAWALKNHYKSSMSFGELTNILNWSNNYQQMVKNLPKGTITANNNQRDIISMYDEMIKLRREKRAKDVINTFNTAQKKLLKNIDLDDKIIFILNRFSTLSEVKKRNFIRKMSTIDDVNEIIKQMSFAINLHFEWNYNSLMEYLKNSEVLKYEIVYDNNNIVIVKCFDYDTVKHLGKTTNWCISKNKSYWNNYLSDSVNKQYIMFNFNETEDSEHSIIGFTSSHDSYISHAHSFTNENLINGVGMFMGTLKCFSSPNNIVNIFDNLNINYFNFFDKKEIQYSWNKESFISYIESKSFDYDILLDEGNKFVISLNGEYVAKIVNEKIYNSSMGRYRKLKHIVFADFSRNENDCDRIRFSVINRRSYTFEEYPMSTYNIYCRPSSVSFDSILKEFNLPYDIICRTEDKIRMVKDALYSYDMEMLESLFKDAILVNNIKSKKFTSIFSREDFYDRIFCSLIEYRSLDLLQLIYHYGIKLTDVCCTNDVSSLIVHLLDIVLRNNSNGRIPSINELENFNNKTITNCDKNSFIGFFIALDMILNHETRFDKLEIFYHIQNYNFNCQITNYIYDKIFNTIDFTKKNELSVLVFNHCVKFKNLEYLDKISKVLNLNKYFSDGIMSFNVCEKTI